MVDLPRLNLASQLTLVTIRLWVLEHLRGRPQTTPWDEGLVAAGLPLHARRALDELLTMLALMPDALSGVLPLCAHRISDAELGLLRLFAKDQDSVAPRPALLAALPPTMARLARDRCQSYAVALAQRVCTLDTCPPLQVNESTTSPRAQANEHRMH